MKELQFSIIETSKKERRDVNKLKHANLVRQKVITALPILICALIPLLWMIYYYFNEGTLQKDIHFILTDFPLHALGDCPPFIIAAIYAYYLTRKERSNREIAIKMSCILLPIMLFSFYWYAKTFPDPLALGVLPFINMIILIPAWLTGLAVNAALKDARNQ